MHIKCNSLNSHLLTQSCTYIYISVQEPKALPRQARSAHWFTTQWTLIKGEQRSLSFSHVRLIKSPPSSMAHLENLSSSTRLCCRLLLLRPLSYIWKKQNDFTGECQQLLKQKYEVITNDNPRIAVRFRSSASLSQETGWYCHPPRKLTTQDRDFKKEMERMLFFGRDNELSQSHTNHRFTAGGSTYGQME